MSDIPSRKGGPETSHGFHGPPEFQGGSAPAIPSGFLPPNRDYSKPRKCKFAVQLTAPGKPEDTGTLGPLSLLDCPVVDDATLKKFCRILVALGRGRVALASSLAGRIRRLNVQERGARLKAHAIRVAADLASGVADDPPEDPWVFLDSPT
jgi:hypothetical protein